MLPYVAIAWELALADDTARNIAMCKYIAVCKCTGIRSFEEGKWHLLNVLNHEVIVCIELRVIHIHVDVIVVLTQTQIRNE